MLKISVEKDGVTFHVEGSAEEIINDGLSIVGNLAVWLEENFGIEATQSFVGGIPLSIMMCRKEKPKEEEPHENDTL